MTIHQIYYKFLKSVMILITAKQALGKGVKMEVKKEVKRAVIKRAIKVRILYHQ